MKKWYKLMYPDGSYKTIGELKGHVLHMTRRKSVHMWKASDRYGWALPQQVIRDDDVQAILFHETEENKYYSIDKATIEALIVTGDVLAEIHPRDQVKQVVFSEDHFDLFSGAFEKFGDGAKAPLRQAVRRPITADEALFLLSNEIPVYCDDQQLFDLSNIKNWTIAEFLRHTYTLEGRSRED